MNMATVRKELHLFLGLVIICFTLMMFTFIQAIPEGARITALPGFEGEFRSNHYSGYVEIHRDTFLFYYFVVSERKPESDPVVLWLNGGPGCSSFDGFVNEHGPFNFKTGEPHVSLPKLQSNRYRWSKVSNIIYLDSPVGVGFSYSKDKSKYETGDHKTAIDIYTFLAVWFDLYPEFVNNRFYIAGEDYAGVYIPTLATQIIQGIERGVEPKINFTGYLMGNGVAINDFGFDVDAKIIFIHGMGIISDELFKDIQDTCKTYDDYKEGKCDNYLAKVDKIIEGMNQYNILEPCYHPPEPDTKLIGTSTSMPLLVRNRTAGLNEFAGLWTNSEGVHDCHNDEVATTWLNDEFVRKAIHAEPVDAIGPWVICLENFVYKKDARSMVPYHKKLTTAGYRSLIYSGDHGMVVPFTGSKQWIKELGYGIVDEWRQWTVNEQVAGFLQEYDHNLTFLTIKGAGHRVAKDKPREAYHFYRHWLHKNPI